MKKSLFICIAMLTMVTLSCKSQQSPKQVTAAGGENIEVYYFHMTSRCITCLRVQSEASNNIEILYGDLLKAGKISFTALNLEEADGKALGQKLGVTGQTLLIVKGDQKINITNEGFLYAVSKPDKFREIMKEKIDSLVR